LLRNRFEIILDSRDVISGKFVAGLSGTVQDTFGKRVTALLDETEVLDKASGETKTFYTLKGAELSAPH
jgi:hypothetical protein